MDLKEILRVDVKPKEEFLRRLKPEELHFLGDYLPRPAIKYEYSPENAESCVIFEVYKAKEMYDPNWLSPALYRILLDTRASYKRWGGVSLLNDFDDKAVIYLVRVIYRLSGGDWEEWLSMRFYPGDGNPFGIEDVDLYVYREDSQDISMEDFIKGRFLGTRNLEFRNLINASRQCGTGAYRVNQDCAELSPHRYLTLFFVLAHKSFLREYGGRNQFHFLAHLITEKLAGRLTFETGNQRFAPNFVWASKILNIDESKILLNRKKYIYRYPLHFLDNAAVIKFIKDLINQNRLTSHTSHTVDYYFQDLTLTDIVNDKWRDKMAQFSIGLGKLFTAAGPLVGSTMTGEEIRKYLDGIGDNPDLHLRMIGLKEWEESLDAIINAAKIKIV